MPAVPNHFANQRRVPGASPGDQDAHNILLLWDGILQVQEKWFLSQEQRLMDQTEGLRPPAARTMDNPLLLFSSDERHPAQTSSGPNVAPESDVVPGATTQFRAARSWGHLKATENVA